MEHSALQRRGESWQVWAELCCLSPTIHLIRAYFTFLIIKNIKTGTENALRSFKLTIPCGINYKRNYLTILLIRRWFAKYLTYFYILFSKSKQETAVRTDQEDLMERPVVVALK